MCTHVHLLENYGPLIFNIWIQFASWDHSQSSIEFGPLECVTFRIMINFDLIFLLYKISLINYKKAKETIYILYWNHNKKIILSLLNARLLVGKIAFEMNLRPIFIDLWLNFDLSINILSLLVPKHIYCCKKIDLMITYDTCRVLTHKRNVFTSTSGVLYLEKS